MSENEGRLEEVCELKQYVCDLLNTCTKAWRYLILGEEKKAMGLMTSIIDLLEEIISAESTNPLSRLCYGNIASLLPGLLKAMEERNGILLADIIEYKLKPALKTIL